MDKIKVNLGSGTDYIQGWVNVDIEPFYHPDVIADLQKPFPFSDNSVDEVKAFDIIEHFTKEDGEVFLRECHRILKVGGIVTFRSHDVYEIFNRFSNDPEVMIHFLYGNTEVTGVFGAHKFAYTKEFATFLLKKIGFSVLSYSKEDTNFVLAAKKQKKHLEKKLKVALISADTQTELLQTLSLNESVSLSEKIEKNQRYDVVLASGGIQKILTTVMCHFTNTPIVWLENGAEVSKIGHPFISKILYRLVRKIPARVLVQNQAASVPFMMHSRVSLSKVRFLTPGENIHKSNESSQQKILREANTVVDALRDAVLLTEL